eukprot:TRINITY_DN13191_c0_g1_i1.p1 TRINITY_DN13191_c0_g1~~TRINITY_DN13191_c0_g1_i1.p1  ORF type:complete len:229 (+),score=24.21 TRINITY_DN13191_c0_g1_i1:46-687(+)
MPYSVGSDQYQPSSIHQFDCQGRRLPSCILPPRMTKALEKQNGESRVFSKLTDHSLYTGASRHRFDEEGYGLPTCDERTKYSGGRVMELSQITRPNLNATGRTSIGIGTDGAERKNRVFTSDRYRQDAPDQEDMYLVDEHPLLVQPQPAVFEKLTTTALYTGSHRAKAGYAPIVNTRECPDVPPSVGPRLRWMEGLRGRTKKATLQEREQNWR